MNTTLIFYDSACISSFLKINKSELLKKLFSEILVPKQVYDELTTPDSYWPVKQKIELLKKEGYVKIAYIESSYNELKNYKSMIDGESGRPIGKGEAAALSLVISNKGIIASNNLKDIKKIAKNNDVPILTSSIIFAALYDKGELSIKEIEKCWKKMIMKNTKLPKQKFIDYYTNQFKTDYKEFDCKKYYENLIETE